MPYTQPTTPPPDRLVKLPDGGYQMTLLPGDGKRIEWVWGYDSERPQVGKHFTFSVDAGIIEATVPAGQEWCLWQLHAPDSDPTLAASNPFLLLLVKDGVGEIRLLHEFSTPYNKSLARIVVLASGIRFGPGKTYRWDIDGVIGKAGSVRIRRDGLLLADYVGPFGYNMTGNPYWKAGIYKWAPFDWLGRIVIKLLLPIAPQ